MCHCDRTADMLSMAVSILALQRQLTELKNQVESMRTSKTSAPTNLRRAVGLLRIWGRFLSTKQGQALIAILTPVIAAAIKWLLGAG
jgi:hypothetical protein